MLPRINYCENHTIQNLVFVVEALKSDEVYIAGGVFNIGCGGGYIKQTGVMRSQLLFTVCEK